jgi:hypothetical protein
MANFNKEEQGSTLKLPCLSRSVRQSHIQQVRLIVDMRKTPKAIQLVFRTSNRTCFRAVACELVVSLDARISAYLDGTCDGSDFGPRLTASISYVFGLTWHCGRMFATLSLRAYDQPRAVYHIAVCYGTLGLPRIYWPPRFDVLQPLFQKTAAHFLDPNSNSSNDHWQWRC